MTALNRMIAVLLSVVVLAYALAYIALPGWLASVIPGTSATVDPVGFWIAVLVAGVAGLLLLAELWPSRRRGFESSIEGAVVEYPLASVREAVEKEGEATPGVRHARGEVDSRRGGVDLRMTLEPEPGYDAQEMANKAAARVREKLERGMGLRVERLRMTVRPGQAGPSLPWRKKPPVSATSVEEEGEATPVQASRS